MHSQESYPLPEDPALARAAAVLGDAEHWGWVFDDRWRLVYMTDALRVSFGNDGAPVPAPSPPPAEPRSPPWATR